MSIDYNNCYACGSQITSKVNYLVHEFQSVKELSELNIKFCESCGFGFSYPELDQSFVNDFYSKIYRGKNALYYINYKN